MISSVQPGCDWSLPATWPGGLNAPPYRFAVSKKLMPRSCARSMIACASAGAAGRCAWRNGASGSAASGAGGSEGPDKGVKARFASGWRRPVSLRLPHMKGADDRPTPPSAAAVPGGRPGLPRGPQEQHKSAPRSGPTRETHEQNGTTWYTAARTLSWSWKPTDQHVCR